VACTLGDRLVNLRNRMRRKTLTPESLLLRQPDIPDNIANRDDVAPARIRKAFLPVFDIAWSKQARGLRQDVSPRDKVFGCCEPAGRQNEGVKGGEEGGQPASKLTSLWRSRDSGSQTRLTGLNPSLPQKDNDVLYR